MDVDELALMTVGENNDGSRVPFSDIQGVSPHELYRPPRIVKPEYYLDENGEKKDSIISLPVELIKVLFRDEFKCPICLGTLDKTWTVAACLHRFCAECLHRSLRSDLGPKSHHECPSCRAKMASRRASKPDNNFDLLIHQFTFNGRLVPADSLVVTDETPTTSSTEAGALGDARQAGSDAKVIQDVLKIDDILDLEHYRRVHREKVEQFKGQSQANKKRFYSSGETSYSSLPSTASVALSKKPRVPPQQLTSNLQADKINMEPTVNVSIFPCPKWKESDGPSFWSRMPSNPALRDDGLLLLKKPYLRVPPQLRIVDLKQFLKMKYLLSDEQLDGLQVIVNHQEKDGGDGALVLVVAILDDQLLLKDVASKFWDGLGSSKFVLPGLEYDYGELEPFIKAEIMEIHHSKHHATYVNNLNIAAEKLQESIAKNDISSVVSLQQVIKFNGGGHLNHSIFWKNLAPPSKGGGELVDGELKTLIETQYGSFDTFKTTLANATVGVQGSGWGWLGYDKVNKRLAITTTANQDPLEATTGLVPLFGIDVWEHAYYLQYKNVRPDYVKSIWGIVNWKDVAERLSKAKA